MKLTLNKQQILSLINSTYGFVADKSTMPITGNFYLKNTQGSLCMVATDLEIQAKAITTIDIQEDFAFTLPAKKFKDTITMLPTNDTFVLELNSDKALVKAGKTKYSLQTLPADLFPLLKANENTDALGVFTVSRLDLYSALELTAFAQGINDSRPFLNATLLEMSNGILNLVATDAHRLSFNAINTTGDSKDFVQILPRRTIAELINLTKKSTVEQVSFNVYQTQVIVKIGDIEVISKIVVGTYPDYRRIIATPTINCVVNSKDFLDTIKRVTVIGTDKLQTITLHIENNLINITCKNELHESSTDEVACVYAGQPVISSYNNKYWLELLSKLDDKEMNIGITVGGKSNLITLDTIPKFSHTLMPLRG